MKTILINLLLKVLLNSGWLEVLAKYVKMMDGHDPEVVAMNGQEKRDKVRGLLVDEGLDLDEHILNLCIELAVARLKGV